MLQELNLVGFILRFTSIGLALLSSTMVAVSGLGFWPNFLSLFWYTLDLGVSVWGLILWLEASDDETTGAMPTYRSWVINEVASYIEYVAAPWTIFFGLLVELINLFLQALIPILALIGISLPNLTFPWGWMQVGAGVLTIVSYFFIDNLRLLWRYYDEDGYLSSDEACFIFWQDEPDCELAKWL